MEGKSFTCGYCGGHSLTTNARNGVECSGCGATNGDVTVFKAAPFYVMKVKDRLSASQYENIQESWSSFFSNANVPKLMILEEGITIEPLR